MDSKICCPSLVSHFLYPLRGLHRPSGVNASLNITLEINAEFGQGVSDHLKLGVSENTKSLSFKMSKWEY